MKVISLREPYATLIKNKIKLVETRSWKTNYRGELYIHASMSKVIKEDVNNKELMNLLDGRDLRYAWILEDVEELNPINAKGQLGLWNF